MMDHARRLSVVGFVLAFMFVSAAASAQPQRTFVASSGSDTNPCSRSLPCRSFGTAVTAVAAGGEVVALDSAGYGPFTVTKAVTVVASPGVHAAISVFFGDGITINTGPATIVVLRGLTLTGFGADDGIDFTGGTGAALHVEGLVISGFASDGIQFLGPGQLFVKDTTVRDNGARGIVISAGVGGPVSASIERSRFEGHASCGVETEDTARASIRESVASGNGSGFCASGNAAAINVHDSLAANNFSNAIACLGVGSIARAANSIATNNGTGFAAGSDCTFESLGNNLVRGNGTDTNGTITVVSGT